MNSERFLAAGCGWLVSLLVAFNLSAGPGELDWAKRSGGTGVDTGAAVAALSDGSALVTGWFTSAATFGPGEAAETVLNSAGNYDVFLARYNPEGSLVWARRAGGTGSDTGNAVAVLSNGASLITGGFSGSAGFASRTLVSAGDRDIFVARYDNAGTVEWAVRAGGANYDTGRAIAAAADGSSLVTGYFNGDATFGSQPLQKIGNNDIFVAKYNSGGSLDWVKSAGGTGDDRGHGIAALGDGSLAVTGIFWGAGCFFGIGEPNPTQLDSAGSYDVFIARYNANGTLAWAKRAGGAAYDDAGGIVSLGGGSSAITGWFQQTAVFGEGDPNQTVLASTIPANLDGFVARYNADGTLAWASQIRGEQNIYSRAITATGDGGVAVSGDFRGTVVFGFGEPNETSLAAVGGQEIFVAAYRGDGTLAWAKSAGYSDDDGGEGIASPGDGSCLVTGFYEQTAVFGREEAGQTILSSAGSRDIFLARYQGASAASPWITDFNGDGTSDIAIFRRSSGLWAVRGMTRAYFGGSDDYAVPGDYNGDGTTEIGIFRPASGLWAIRGVTRVYFGGGFDMHHPGDYDGDGTWEPAIFRASSGLWAVRGVTRAYFGGTADIPAPGYYRGDGSKSIGVFRPSSGLWAIRGVTRAYFGGGGDIPIPGDYEGAGSWSPAIFRENSGLWAVRGVTRAYFGAYGDMPQPAVYSGGGLDRLGIFRFSSGLWAVRGVTRIYFGQQGDFSVTR